jgi:hypothetical protein
MLTVTGALGNYGHENASLATVAKAEPSGIDPRFRGNDREALRQSEASPQFVVNKYQVG